jgi:hypothetical protein
MDRTLQSIFDIISGKSRFPVIVRNEHDEAIRRLKKNRIASFSPILTKRKRDDRTKMSRRVSIAFRHKEKSFQVRFVNIVEPSARPACERQSM